MSSRAPQQASGVPSTDRIDFRTLAENSPDIIDRFDADFRHLYVNPSGARLLGVTCDQLIGKTIRQTGVPEPFASLWETRIGTVFESGQPMDVADVFPSPSGLRFYESRCIPEPGLDGRVQTVLVISRDSTERKEWEQALERERNLYKDLVASQPSGVYRLRIRAQRPWGESEWVGKVESNYHLEMVSDLFCEILGATREQCEANAAIVVESIHPDDRPDFIKGNVTALETLCPFKWEGRLKVGDKVTWVYFASVPRCLENGDVLWTGILLDVTERKRAAEAAQAAEARYRHLFDSMVNGFALHEVILDATGVPCDYRYLDANMAFERLTGLRVKDIIGRRILEIAPQTERRWIEAFGRVAMTGETAQFEDYWTVHQKYYEVIAYRPAPGQFACVFADVTERKRAEDAIREVKDSLERKVSERTSELTLANAQLTQRTGQLARLTAELVQAEQREQRRLAEFLHDNLQQLLVGARMQAHALYSSAPQALGASLTQLIGTLTDAINAARDVSQRIAPPVAVSGHLPEAFEWLVNEAKRLHNLVVTTVFHGHLTAVPEAQSILLFTSARELLLNVVKHAGVLQADLQLARKDGAVILTVSDSGRGLDTAAPDATEPNGVGLFSIRERSESMGGSLSLESSPGRGTRVVIRLPLTVTPAERQTPRARRPRHPAEA